MLHCRRCIFLRETPFGMRDMYPDILHNVSKASCYGKVASGTQVVLHEAGVDSDLAARLGRGYNAHSAGGLL